MKYAVIYVVVAAIVALRVWKRRALKRARGRTPSTQRPARRSSIVDRLSGPVALVALREVRERGRTRVFRIGTVVLLLVVAAAIVVPVLHRGHEGRSRVAVVGTLTARLRTTVLAVAHEAGVKVSFAAEPSVDAAKRALRSGAADLVVVDGRRLVTDAGVSAGSSSSIAQLALGVAEAIGVQNAVVASGITPAQATALAHPRPLPITSLQQAKHDDTARSTAPYGLILIFVLLSQYCTWVLMGVVEEKASRVVEVLLATLRPAQLLTGKVAGIGTVALGQGALIVGVALVLAKAVGSDLVRGSAPVEVLGILVWLVVGYAFYSWVYAAAGSLAERQEHVQSLAFPLQLPILFGYIVSLTALGAGSPSSFIEVLAYLPPTAPFAMPVLVALGAVAWWQFAASVLLTLAATVGVARLAAVVYRRAVLRTGRRIRLREVLAASG